MKMVFGLSTSTDWAGTGGGECAGSGVPGYAECPGRKGTMTRTLSGEYDKGFREQEAAPKQRVEELRTANPRGGHAGFSGLRKQSAARGNIQEMNTVQNAGTGLFAFAVTGASNMRVRRITFLAHLGIIVLGQFLLSGSAFSMSYSIRGTLSYESHGISEPEGLKKVPLERDFEVLVDGCNWRVKMVPVGNTNYSYFLTAYDGSNVVYVSRLNAQARERLTRKYASGQTRTPLFSSCVVDSSPVPGRIAPVADAYAWLAFASGCYFKALTNGTALDYHPLATPSGLFSARRDLPTRFKLSPVSPYLPIQVDYLWTNRAAMMPDGKVISYDLPAPFRRGFLAAQFKAEGFTNVGGGSFPSKFEVKEYAPLPTATSESDFRCMVIVRGSVTAISTAPQQWPNELAGETFHVTDRRFPNSPTYLITNGVAPAPGDAMLVLAEKRASLLLANGVKANRALGNAKRVWVWVLGVVVLAPPIFLLAKHYSGAGSRKKSQNT